MKIALQPLDKLITDASGQTFHTLKSMPVGGGCIGDSYRLKGRDRDYFVKCLPAPSQAVLDAEIAGLQAILATHTVAAPHPLCCDVVANQAVLVLEWLEMQALGGGSARNLGQKLAEMHAIAQPYFGWHDDNWIGTSPQLNTPCRDGQDWVAFWRTNRLGFQLDLAARNGHGGRLQQQGARLLERLPVFFENYHPYPSLLHGDLWGGNAASNSNHEGLIYDPACYFGDREADIAMTELFGGFGQDFYAAYRETLALDPGYPVRKTLYNVYHILNHLNLFGGGYQSQALGMIERLLAETV
jgi:protein-ribulosamine 3-kinase